MLFSVLFSPDNKFFLPKNKQNKNLANMGKSNIFNHLPFTSFSVVGYKPVTDQKNQSIHLCLPVSVQSILETVE